MNGAMVGFLSAPKSICMPLGCKKVDVAPRTVMAAKYDRTSVARPAQVPAPLKGTMGSGMMAQRLRGKR